MLPFLVAMKRSFELHGFIDLTEAPGDGTGLLFYIDSQLAIRVLSKESRRTYTTRRHSILHTLNLPTLPLPHLL